MVVGGDGGFLGEEVPGDGECAVLVLEYVHIGGTDEGGLLACASDNSVEGGLRDVARSSGIILAGDADSSSAGGVGLSRHNLTLGSG